jgi:hypothetical protein
MEAGRRRLHASVADHLDVVRDLAVGFHFAYLSALPHDRASHWVGKCFAVTDRLRASKQKICMKDADGFHLSELYFRRGF